MECMRLDEPSDPEMGSPEAVRLCFRFLCLCLEQFPKPALDELILALTTERFLAAGVDRRFGHDEQRHDGGSSRSHVYRDCAAHAMPQQAALAQSQGVDE